MSTDTKHLLRSGGPCMCGGPACVRCFGEPPEETDGDALAAEVRRTRDGIIAQAARLIRLPVEDPADAETVRQVVVALTGLADGLKTGQDALAEVGRLVAKDLLAEASHRVDTLAEFLAKQASPTIPEGCAQ